MSNEPVVLTREALYQQVWSEPIIHVAGGVGLRVGDLESYAPGTISRSRLVAGGRRSDMATGCGRLLCRQSRIPRLKRIVFHVSESQPPEADAPEFLRESNPEWRIDVPEDLQISHPLVKRAATAIRTASRERSKDRVVLWRDRYQAKLLKPGPGYLDIAVSKSLLPRALRIMQALLTAFDKRGYPTSVTAKNETIVRVLDEPFQIALTERFKQVVVKHSSGQGMDLEPSGRLNLRIGSTYDNAGVADRPPHLMGDSATASLLD